MVNGCDEALGMDEFSLSGPTRVIELRNGTISRYEVMPEDFGMKTAPFESIASRSSAGEN
jgi:anthranilate phosphoribosyltransferase